MLGGQADVLVEMKQLDARPVDVGAAHQGGEELELRGAGGGDDAGAPARRDGGAHRRRRALGRRRAHRHSVRKETEFHRPDRLYGKVGGTEAQKRGGRRAEGQEA